MINRELTRIVIYSRLRSRESTVPIYRIDLSVNALRAQDRTEGSVETLSYQISKLCQLMLGLVVRERGAEAMPTRNVNLTDTLDHFIVEKVKSGRYENASEVMRAALRALEREEKEYEAKLAALRSAIDAGDSSGVARGDVFRRVRQKLGRIAKPE